MSLLVSNELYSVSSSQVCHRCALQAPVIALAAPELVHDGEPSGEATIGGELLLLYDLSAMPPTVHALLRQRNARYGRQRTGAETGSFYYGNHCPCGSEFHDVWLLDWPGAAFAPRDEREAAGVRLERLPVIGRLRFEGGCYHGAGDLIWRHGRVA